MVNHITSREYKLMLNTDRFRDREQGVVAFWDLVRHIVHKANRVSDINTQLLEKPVKERCTYYLDTLGCDFNSVGWVLRKRQEQKHGKEKFKTTLKFRSPDRYICASKDLSVNAKNSETKFEEDVVPAFSSKYSYSTSFETHKDDPSKIITDVVNLFPGIKELGFPKDVKIRKVNDFTAHEIVYHIGNFRVGKDKIRINCCVSFWYLLGKKDMHPLAAEFSFDYDRDTKVGFPVDVCKAAKYIFLTLQKQEGWVKLNGTTKTAFAYSGF